MTVGRTDSRESERTLWDFRSASSKVAAKDALSWLLQPTSAAAVLLWAPLLQTNPVEEITQCSDSFVVGG